MSNLNSIDRLEAYLKMLESKGKIFTVEFTKKDGSLRKMSCRLGVKLNLKGTGLKYVPRDKRLICVFDMGKRAYRMINLKTISKLSINKEAYKVN